MSFTILFVEDEDVARESLTNILTKKGYIVLEAPTLKIAKEYYFSTLIDIVLLDVDLPDGNGLTLLEEPIADFYKPRFIVTTGSGDIKMAVNAMRNGAHDFLEKPIQMNFLLDSIKNAEAVIEMQREISHYRQTFEDNTLNFVPSTNPGVIKAFKIAVRAAKKESRIMIYGEMGTGKEILAKAIHVAGPRADKKFVPINCAAISDETIETSLFGHEPGAFTSADKRHIGLFEYADGGIVFLDEISAMSLKMQAKLLRTLEENTITRMNGNVEIPINVQVIAATNKDLTEMIKSGDFQADLYHRLNTIPITIPPLRDRKEDIPKLVGYFIDMNNEKSNDNIEGITSKALEQLQKFDYPGNIRELRNIIERAVIYCDDAIIDVQHLGLEIQQL